MITIIAAFAWALMSFALGFFAGSLATNSLI
jgi:hypothetical protein